MERKIEVYVTDTVQLNERIIDFFEGFGIRLIDKKNGFMIFKRKSSLFDPWKSNPLNWSCEVFVSIVDNLIIANFCIDTEVQMNTGEEDDVWSVFFDSFKNYLIKGEISNKKLISTISENKKSRLNYLLWTFLGAIFGGLLSLLYSKFAGTQSILNILFIPIFATLFLRYRISYGKTKNAL
jgi:hypothetical protein